MALTHFSFGVTGSFSGGALIQALSSNTATTEAKTPSGTAGATTAAAAVEGVCRVATDTAVYVSFGTSPNATSDSVKFFIPAGAIDHFVVRAGDKASVVTA